MEYFTNLFLYCLHFIFAELIIEQVRNILTYQPLSFSFKHFSIDFCFSKKQQLLRFIELKSLNEMTNLPQNALES